MKKNEMNNNVYKIERYQDGKLIRIDGCDTWQLYDSIHYISVYDNTTLESIIETVQSIVGEKLSQDNIEIISRNYNDMIHIREDGSRILLTRTLLLNRKNIMLSYEKTGFENNKPLVSGRIPKIFIYDNTTNECVIQLAQDIIGDSIISPDKIDELISYVNEIQSKTTPIKIININDVEIVLLDDGRIDIIPDGTYVKYICKDSFKTKLGIIRGNDSVEDEYGDLRELNYYIYDTSKGDDIWYHDMIHHSSIILNNEGDTKMNDYITYEEYLRPITKVCLPDGAYRRTCRMYDNEEFAKELCLITGYINRVFRFGKDEYLIPAIKVEGTDISNLYDALIKEVEFIEPYISTMVRVNITNKDEENLMILSMIQKYIISSITTNLHTECKFKYNKEFFSKLYILIINKFDLVGILEDISDYIDNIVNFEHDNSALFTHNILEYVLYAVTPKLKFGHNNKNFIKHAIHQYVKYHTNEEQYNAETLDAIKK